MGSDITVIATYPCPGCGVGLEAVEDPSVGWLRCPRCGRPSLAPFAVFARRMESENGLANGHATGLSGDVLLIMDDEAAQRPRYSWPRILAIILGVSIPVAICLVLRQEPFEAAMLGLVMAVALFALLRPTARR